MNISHNYIPLIPLTVPQSYKDNFIKNYQTLTHSTDRLFLFTTNHKIEHLNQDFYGTNINIQAIKVEHIFNIANNNYIGGMVAQLGLISRYGSKYSSIPYIVKLNSMTNLISTDKHDPLSKNLWSVSDVINFKKISNLNICAIGLTLYLGNKYENIMLEQAAQTIYQAHSNGLVTILWIHPNELNSEKANNFEFTIGAAAVANTLGADFVKIKTPKATDTQSSPELLKTVTQAAGNTKVICSTTKNENTEDFLRNLYDQITIGSMAGCAIGPQIFQQSRTEAIALTKAINLMIYNKTDLNTALNAYEHSI